jgi:hypothetical protein
MATIKIISNDTHQFPADGLKKATFDLKYFTLALEFADTTKIVTFNGYHQAFNASEILVLPVKKDISIQCEKVV